MLAFLCSFVNEKCLIELKIMTRMNEKENSGGCNMQNKAVLKVYGREQICASCVGAPGSIDTYEWLQAAINRKFDSTNIDYEYIDMDQPQEDEQDAQLIEQMEEEDWLFPLVMLNKEIIAEGIPHIKKIYEAIDTLNIDKV